MEKLQLTTVYTGNSCSGEAIIIPVMPIDPEYATAYIRYQTYGKTYSPAEGLKQGTIFPELVDYWVN
jgi:hypothetical protein